MQIVSLKQPLSSQSTRFIEHLKVEKLPMPLQHWWAGSKFSDQRSRFSCTIAWPEPALFPAQCDSGSPRRRHRSSGFTVWKNTLQIVSTSWRTSHRPQCRWDAWPHPGTDLVCPQLTPNLMVLIFLRDNFSWLDDNGSSPKVLTDWGKNAKAIVGEIGFLGIKEQSTECWLTSANCCGGCLSCQYKCTQHLKNLKYLPPLLALHGLTCFWEW